MLIAVGMMPQIISRECVCLSICKSATLLLFEFYKILISCNVRNVANTATMTKQFSLSFPKWPKLPHDFCSVGQEGEVE